MNRPSSAAEAALSAAVPLNARHGLALAAIAAVFFSAKAIIAKLLYRHGVDAVLVLTLRMVLAAPFFAAVAAWQFRHAPPLTRRDYALIGVLGLMGYYLSSFLDFLGLQYISAGLERLILFLTPSIVLLIAATVMRRRIERHQWLALVVAYLGIVLVFVQDLRLGGDGVWLGGALVFGSAVAYAIYLTGTGELVSRVGSTRLVAYAMCVSTGACVAQFLVLRPIEALAVSCEVYGLSLLNAVFCTVLPVFLTMAAVARVGAPAVSQTGMIGPVSTVFLGALILDEPVTGLQLAGSALVMGGMYLLSRGRR
ncbi:DMT family transporter [Tahibacter amnicola]|uniref:DMT family transporter n=1 Tax=Tahibacter amnicola TaxID=2976241 RepID=A0ABY6BGQ4_9GAMM|nr:DMT family transporter [Tahibacter amnicola]UXI68957.1 DMT family transporter [Tahibacter amnicola]